MIKDKISLIFPCVQVYDLWILLAFRLHAYFSKCLMLYACFQHTLNICCHWQVFYSLEFLGISTGNIVIFLVGFTITEHNTQFCENKSSILDVPISKLYLVFYLNLCNFSGWIVPKKSCLFDGLLIVWFEIWHSPLLMLGWIILKHFC